MRSMVEGRAALSHTRLQFICFRTSRGVRISPSGASRHLPRFAGEDPAPAPVRRSGAKRLCLPRGPREVKVVVR